MHADIDPDLLRVFIAVADCGGFTRAARTLNRTQSAVSMQIKRLEDGTRARLFDRAGRSVRLTPDGETLVDYARRILALNDEAVRALTQNRLQGTVRLGMMADYATAIMPAILAEFAERHPQIYVEVHTGLTADMPKRIGRGLDLALVMSRAGTGTGEMLRREQTVWAAARTHAVAAQDPLPLALYPRGCLFREWALAALERAGRRWRLAYMSANTSAVEAAVSAGLAVSVFKAGTVPRHLRILGPKDRLPKLPTAEIALHRAPDLSRAATALADHIAERLRSA